MLKLIFLFFRSMSLHSVVLCLLMNGCESWMQMAMWYVAPFIVRLLCTFYCATSFFRTSIASRFPHNSHIILHRCPIYIALEMPMANSCLPMLPVHKEFQVLENSVFLWFLGASLFVYLSYVEFLFKCSC